ncbi:hypothetical protein SO802_014090 [Lithocarpus litseifolius]|uniref:Uncharacterized protein n=1 Tax=Lithocarpus litseifolius TaxID=425828 RepID=A0AAW2D8U4_9ROSI
MNQNQNHVLGLYPILRSESFGYYSEQNYTMMEKRQLFLRSYQFCRKRSLSERLKGSFIRVKRVICLRLRSARRFRKLVCSRLRYGFYYRRRRFLRLVNNNKNYSSSNCFCDWKAVVGTLVKALWGLQLFKQLLVHV